MAQQFTNSSSSISQTAVPSATTTVLPSTTSSSSATSTSYGSPTTEFPGATGLCCAMYPNGVGVNSWYTQNVSAVVATVHSTFLEYNGTRVLNGTSTEYANNATSFFGTYGAGHATKTFVPGVDPNLLPVSVALYASSFVGTATEITFPAQNLTITSPTAFWYYQIATVGTGYSSGGSCYTTMAEYTSVSNQVVNGTYYPSPTTLHLATQTSAFEFDPSSSEDFIITLDYAVPFNGNITEYMATLQIGGPGDFQFGAFPDWPGSQFANIPGITSQFESIGYCSVAGGEGEPTVHIPVNVLTADSTTVLTMAGPAPATPSTTSQTTQAAPTALPVTTSSPADSPVSPSTSTKTPEPPISTTSQPANPPTGATTAPIISSQVSPPAPAATEPSTISSAQSSNSNDANRPSQASQGGIQASAQPVATTSGGLGNLISAIQQLGSTTAATAANTVGSDGDSGQTSTQTAGQTSGEGNNAGTTGADLSVPVTQQTTTVSAESATNPIASFIASGIGLSSGQDTAVSDQAAAVTVGSSVVIANSASAFVLPGSQTLAPGGSAVTLSGTTYSVASAGTALVVNGQSTPIAVVPASNGNAARPVAAAITIGSSVISANSGSAFVVGGSQTLAPGGPAVTISGTTYSVASGASTLVVDGLSTPIAVAGNSGIASSGSVLVAGQTLAYPRVSDGAVIFGSSTILPGSAATIFGQQVSVASNGVVNIDGSAAATIPPATASATGMVTIGTQAVAYSQAGPGNVVLGGQTVAAGASAIMIDGQAVSFASNGVLNVDKSPVTTLASAGYDASTSTGVVTLASQTVDVTFLGTGVVIGSQILGPGHTVVVDGQTLTLASNNSALEVLSASSVISTLHAASSGGSTTSAASVETSSISAASSPSQTTSVSGADTSYGRLSLLSLTGGMLMILALM